MVDRQIVPARQNEMEFFGLQKDALLLHIKRVRTADSEPILRRTSFVPFDAYRELLTPILRTSRFFRGRRRVGGTPIVSVGYRTVEAVRANTEQAAELGIAPHDPLLNLRAGFIGPNGEPVLMGKQYYVGSRYVMSDVSYAVLPNRVTARRCKRPTAILTFNRRSYRSTLPPLFVTLLA